MSFWERNRGLLIGAIAAAVVAGIVHFGMAGSWRSQAQAVEKKNSEGRAHIAKFSPPKDMPTPQALEVVLKKREGIDKIIQSQRRWLMVQPREYQLSKNEPNPQLFFESHLNELRKRCQEQGGRYTGRPCPLGFTDEIQKEEVQLLLQRLAAVRILADAADAARVAQVQSVTLGRPALLTSPGVGSFHLRILPMTMRFLADERQLTALLTEISQSKKPLALQTLALEVADPKARTFYGSIEVLALVERSEAPPARKPDGGGPGVVRPLPPAGRW